jgi:hypothetical protein
MSDSEIADRLGMIMFRQASAVEEDLARRIARQLSRGIDGPRWAQVQLAEVTRLRSSWERVIADWVTRSRETSVGIVRQAGEAGERAALADLRGALLGTALDSPLPGARAVLGLAEELSGAIASTQFGILRAAEDIFRRVIAETAGTVLLGSQTRRTAAQLILDRLVSKGISGFTDVRGRRWDLASYVEMAARTTVQRAMVKAHTDTLQARGVQLVIVSNAPQECALCRPWEGRVLSLTGEGRQRLQVQSAVSADVVTVEVAGGLDEAKRAGLLHPNCRHSVNAYLPGLTRPASSEPADPEGDAARQKLRTLERRVRAAKMREAAAMSEAARKAARSDVRKGQAAIRDHVDSTSAKRQRQREQIGRAR